MGDLSSYSETQSQQYSVEIVVRTHAKLVKQIAYHLLSRLPNSVQLDDLVQAGVIGLIEAAQRYDSSREASFETFASIRIRGAMLDELRRSSWLPRSVYQNMRLISEAISKIENRTGRAAQAKDIAKELGLSVDEYHKLAATAHTNDLVSFESVDEQCLPDQRSHAGPFEEVELDDLKEHIVHIIDDLPEREKLLLSLYYTEKLNFKEIAKVLEVTEARVCQLHGQVIARLKARMKNNL